MGYGDAFTQGRDEQAWLKALYEECRGRQLGVEWPEFGEFWQRGHLDVPQGEKPFVFFDAFRNSPEQHPLQTPSGKIELYSDTVARYGYEGFAPHPEWCPPVEWLGAETAARWPLHFISIQPSDRLHSQLAANKTAGKETLYMHPQDANARGIVDEQQVEVFNARGRIYAGVRVTKGVAPGVVVMSTGAWFEPGFGQKEWHAVEQSGNANVLTLDIGTSPLTQGPNAMSCLVDVATA